MTKRNGKKRKFKIDKNRSAQKNSLLTIDENSILHTKHKIHDPIAFVANWIKVWEEIAPNLIKERRAKEKFNDEEYASVLLKYCVFGSEFYKFAYYEFKKRYGEDFAIQLMLLFYTAELRHLEVGYLSKGDFFDRFRKHMSEMIADVINE